MATMEDEMAKYTEAQLIEMGLEMGLTSECAVEMALEHIARRDERLPAYVRSGLWASTGKVSEKVVKFLDRKFGWNADNVHRISGLYVNRDRLGAWYVTA